MSATKKIKQSHGKKMNQEARRQHLIIQSWEASRAKPQMMMTEIQWHEHLERAPTAETESAKAQQPERTRVVQK